MKEAWIVGAVRTPMGRFGGTLAAVRPDDLAAHVLRALLERTGVPAVEIEDVVLGCANQAGEDNRNVARMAALLAGFPETVPGSTVNRLCGSGLEAVATAARGIMVGEGEAYVAGGVESMSRAPWAVAKPERGFPAGPATMFDTSLGWRFVNPEMERLGHTDSMGETAENLVAELSIPRAAQDAFALASHRRAIAAIDSGRIEREIAPVTVKQRKTLRVVAVDEGPRRNTSLEALEALPPAFREGGTVTAGNSSPLSDGAAALLLTSPAFARDAGLGPLARVRSVAVAGVAPRVMGIGPVPATRKALERAGVSLAEVGLVELNEAFAGQALAVLGQLGLDPEDGKVNPNGGAIALGHPLGCSGARILTTLVHEMTRRPDVSLALATMCIGVGQGIALLVDRPDG